MKLIQEGLYKLKKDKNINVLYEVWVTEMDTAGTKEILVDVWEIEDKLKGVYKLAETHSIFYFEDQEFEKLDIKYKLTENDKLTLKVPKKGTNLTKLVKKM